MLSGAHRLPVVVALAARWVVRVALPIRHESCHRRVTFTTGNRAVRPSQQGPAALMFVERRGHKAQGLMTATTMGGEPRAHVIQRRQAGALVVATMAIHTSAGGLPEAEVTSVQVTLRAG